jgi:hypothetical protein
VALDHQWSRRRHRAGRGLTAQRKGKHMAAKKRAAKKKPAKKAKRRAKKK